MSGRRRTEHSGHCKLAALLIRRDARKIAARLAEGEKNKALAVEYGCNQATFRKHLTAAIGAKRWRQLIYHRGPELGSFGRPPKLKEEKIAEETGPHCYHCRTSIEPDTWKCPNCGAMQQG